jgi:hypothetical protein
MNRSVGTGQEEIRLAGAAQVAMSEGAGRRVVLSSQTGVQLW